MGVENTLIHRMLGDGGTLWTNASNSQRPAYEEAVRRYRGPAQIVLCDEAYYASGKADVVLGSISSGPLRRDVNAFSAHVVNIRELPTYDMEEFYAVLKQVRLEYEEGHAT